MSLELGEAVCLVLVLVSQGPPRLLDQFLRMNTHIFYQTTPFFEVQISVFLLPSNYDQEDTSWKDR